MASLPVCSQEPWGQRSAHSEELAITEEDLELIQERETSIRQLEVGSSAGFTMPSHLQTAGESPGICSRVFRSLWPPSSTFMKQTSRPASGQQLSEEQHLQTSGFAHMCLSVQSDIMDVNQIFKDLAVMIHDQGEMIGG